MDYEKRTYYRDDDIHVYLENINKQVFIHVGLTKASKASIKRMKEKWGEVVQKMFVIGYHSLFAYTKDNRVIKMIGGAEKIGSQVDPDTGDLYEVYKWDLS